MSFLRYVVCVVEGMSDGFDVDGFNVLEVSAVVGQKGEAVKDSGTSDHEVEVRNAYASELQLGSLSSKELADVVVQSDNGHPAQKTVEILLGALGVSRAEYAVVEFCH